MEVDSASAAVAELDAESDCDADCAERGDEYRASRAILHHADFGVPLGMQVIGQPLEGGVEQLRCEHGATGEDCQCPPDRSRPQNDECDHYGAECKCLQPQAVLVSQTLSDAIAGVSQPPQKWLIFNFER